MNFYEHLMSTRRQGSAITAKNVGLYLVVIKFKDGKSSLLEVDDNIFKCINAKLALVKYQS